MNDYERICPVCTTAAAADATQCVQCGTLLLGVDLTLKQLAPSPAAAPASPPATAETRCPHTDCAMPNPPGGDACLYCGRPLAAPTCSADQAIAVPVHTADSAVAVPPAAAPISEGAASLYRLPASLAAKFRLVEVLPAGGAEAEIMLLEGLGTGVRVIAKLYRPGILPKSAVLERVNRAGFSHVVRLIAHGIADGVGYEIMEYCPAGSLRQLMAQGPLPRDVLRAIVEEIAAALAALHGIDVIHRDLKPENLLVRRRDPLDLVLTDFGIASVNDATQRFTGLARTVKYGAPETLAGILDRAADYWSFGLILFELLTGHHPFDDLSDAVITHRLVTGTVGLDVIDDPTWRTLCRGLLLRDPQRRWGAAEIRRWLAGDATLAVPEEDVLPAPAPRGARPYRLGEIACATPAELGAALALHWDDGRKDLMRGQLSAWFSQELGDDNLLRFTQDLLDLRDASDDLRLFRLIRRLAPDLPAIWRGGNLALPHLTARAAAAAGGDGAAAEWLVSVFTQKLLRELPAARFPAEAALAARWEAEHARFADAWAAADQALVHWRKTALARDGVVDFDALVFGQPQALLPPPPARLLPALLRLLTDEEQAGRLRQRMQATALADLADNPWLDELLAGDDPLGWLVAECLLPQARAIAADLRKRRESAERAEVVQANTLLLRANQGLARLRETADTGLLAGFGECTVCAEAAQALLDVLEDARRDGTPDDTPLMRALHRAEPVVLRIQEQLDAWEHIARVNEVWRNRNFAQGAGGTVLFVTYLTIDFLPFRYLLWALAGLGLVVGWRISLVLSIRARLRDLGKALPLRVTAAA